MHKLGLTGAVLILAIFCGPLPSLAFTPPKAIAVIVHKSVAINSITRDELRPLFQTKLKTWPDGSMIRAFNLPPNVPARQAFDSAVLGLEPDLMPRYWIDQKVRGDARAPNTVPTPALMLKVVGRLPGAVGYIEAGTVDATVKVIAMIVAGQVTKP